MMQELGCSHYLDVQLLVARSDVPRCFFNGVTCPDPHFGVWFQELGRLTLGLESCNHQVQGSLTYIEEDKPKLST